MADFYKFEISNWNEGTANLSLEQEAAYLRVVNAIRLADQPITFNMHVLCGLWRCDVRVAKRLLNALIDAGKLRIEGDRIINDKAVADATSLLATRQLRRTSGIAGGQASAKSRSKSLESNDTGEASASTREEKRREEKIPEDKSSGESSPPTPEKIMFDSGIKLLASAGIAATKARGLIGKWRKDHGTEAVLVAFGRAQREGAIDPVAFIEGCFRFKAKTELPKAGETRKIGDGKWESYDVFLGWRPVLV